MAVGGSGHHAAASCVDIFATAFQEGWTWATLTRPRAFCVAGPHAVGGRGPPGLKARPRSCGGRGLHTLRLARAARKVILARVASWLPHIRFPPCFAVGSFPAPLPSQCPPIRVFRRLPSSSLSPPWRRLSCPLRACDPVCLLSRSFSLFWF